jgi:hypothetical protein
LTDAVEDRGLEADLNVQIATFIALRPTMPLLTQTSSNPRLIRVSLIFLISFFS